MRDRSFALRRVSHTHVNIMECYIINYNYNFSYLGLFTVNVMIEREGREREMIANEIESASCERFKLRFIHNTNVSLYGIRMIKKIRYPVCRKEMAHIGRI